LNDFSSFSCVAGSLTPAIVDSFTLDISGKKNDVYVEDEVAEHCR